MHVYLSLETFRSFRKQNDSYQTKKAPHEGNLLCFANIVLAKTIHFCIDPAVFLYGTVIHHLIYIFV